MEMTQELALELFEYRDGMLLWKSQAANKRAKIGEMIGSVNHHGYVQAYVGGKIYSEHRLVFLMHHGFLPQYIDHRDGDRMNNRIENLREATHAENQHNRRKNLKNTSGHKGVYLNKKTGKWYAVICVNRKYTYLGLHDRKEDAAQAYKMAAEKYHGEFACAS
jgi:hypothetical protein